MSTDQGPHGLRFHNDGISFDPAGAGGCELCDNLSANCLFFLVFQSATRAFGFTGYLGVTVFEWWGWDESSGREARLKPAPERKKARPVTTR